MRRALRTAFVVMLAFLVQSIILPHFKINGVILDLIVITLYTIGYALGPYAGITAGLLCALVMEVLSGDLPGLTAVLCIGAGAVGFWSAQRIRQFRRPGRRAMEQNIKRFAPVVAVALYEMAKEALYVVYFYLTGMDIVFRHVFQTVWAGVEVGLFSLLLIPLIAGFLLRRPEDTWLARRIRKRQARAKARPVKAKTAGGTPGMPSKGGMDT